MGNQVFGEIPCALGVLGRYSVTARHRRTGEHDHRGTPAEGARLVVRKCRVGQYEAVHAARELAHGPLRVLTLPASAPAAAPRAPAPRRTRRGPRPRSRAAWMASYWPTRHFRTTRRAPSAGVPLWSCSPVRRCLAVTLYLPRTPRAQGISPNT